MYTIDQKSVYYCQKSTTIMKRSSRSGLPTLVNIGLLILRIWLGAGLFVKHGLEKVIHFPEMAAHFPDPIHVGMKTGLIFALLSDALCSLLVVAGLFTRLAALIIIINLLVVFGFINHLSFMADQAELVYTYLGGFLVLLFTGAGKFSVDARL
jgi:putative oxidoreductase